MEALLDLGFELNWSNCWLVVVVRCLEPAIEFNNQMRGTVSKVQVLPCTAYPGLVLRAVQHGRGPRNPTRTSHYH